MPNEATKKPIILAVDDDLGVLGAVARDLRREYGANYRILRADSGEAALELLEKAKLANDPVALFLVDQRMPNMAGVDFLGHARQLYPGAKRVLLTAYADSAASIQAINETQLDYYLMKPWDPPEERLYPVITDLLDDWHAEFQPAIAALTVIGHPYSAASHTLKEFLGRNVVPYRWLDVEVAYTQAAGEGSTIARDAYRAGLRDFIAVGGDGTGFEIVNGLFPLALGGASRPTLGFLPLGTGNSFLRDFSQDGARYSAAALVAGQRRPPRVLDG